MVQLQWMEYILDPVIQDGKAEKAATLNSVAQIQCIRADHQKFVELEQRLTERASRASAERTCLEHIIKEMSRGRKPCASNGMVTDTGEWRDAREPAARRAAHAHITGHGHSRTRRERPGHPPEAASVG